MAEQGPRNWSCIIILTIAWQVKEPICKKKLSNVKLLIIDEIFMMQ